jgi:NAD-dependent dihydropyrimidine dehydrogenase PreA subunit
MSDEYDEYHGAHREKITWHPTIDYKKCVSCGTCVDYCKLGVFDVVNAQGEKKPVVKNPTSCVVFCTGCEDQCPVGAISFPSKQDTRKRIKELEEAEK